jgi:hypothetical protein
MTIRSRLTAPSIRCNRRPALLVASALTALAVTLAACGGGEPEQQQASTSTSTPPVETRTSSTPSTPIPSEAQPAVEAYLKFAEAVNRAQVNPPRVGFSPGGDFRPYSFNPAQGQLSEWIGYSFVNREFTMKGSLPLSRPVVTSINLNQFPYPSIWLEDCPTVPSDWKAYSTVTGEEIEVEAPPAPHPHPITVEMIYNQKHWGAARYSIKENVTCTR